jgi:hypothetical protein
MSIISHLKVWMIELNVFTVFSLKSVAFPSFSHWVDRLTSVNSLALPVTNFKFFNDHGRVAAKEYPAEFFVR